MENHNGSYLDVVVNGKSRLDGLLALQQGDQGGESAHFLDSEEEGAVSGGELDEGGVVLPLSLHKVGPRLRVEADHPLPQERLHRPLGGSGVFNDFHLGIETSM